MLFSIVIPVHNGERYLSVCIESALAVDASFAKDPEELYEVIVVENGSTDRTGEIADDFAARSGFVRCLHLGSIGLFAARQEGFKAAKGDWVISLDADDKLLPGMLSVLFKAICAFEDKENKPDLIIYEAAGMAHPDSKLNILPFESGKVCAGREKDIFKEVLCRGDQINAMWIKCIRRELSYLGVDVLGLNYGEDLYQTALYIDRAQGILYLDEILYLYRENEASLSATYNAAYMENQKYVWSGIDSCVEKWNNASYTEDIQKRKSLTCSIAAGKIMYSQLRLSEKKEKLSELMEDSFYKEYAGYELPEWAPEEAIFVHNMQICDDPMGKMIANARKTEIKTFVKKIIGKN